MNTYDKVKQSFGPNAQAYATSATHADAANLAALCQFVKAGPDDEALDVATGAGNLALALAPHVKRVVASDLTPEMVAETTRRAAELGLTNFETVLAPAEALPFPDAIFTLVTCRVGAHHFADIQTSVHEMARVLKLGGRLLIVDITGPEDDGVDQEIHEVEVLRDPSHVRNYRPSEWRSMLEEAGLRIDHLEVGSYDDGRPMPFGPWVERIRTSAKAVAELRKRFLSASPDLKAALQIVIAPDEITFVLPQITLLATKAKDSS